jgi:hypothetical protein
LILRRDYQLSFSENAKVLSAIFTVLIEIHYNKERGYGG